MSREYNESCCWTIEKFSFFHNYFAIIDTADYLADQLFIKHQVRVGFGPEFVCPDAPYRVIMCKCRKRDVDAFLAAIRELPNKMLLCGYPDYLTFCEDLKKNVKAKLFCPEIAGLFCRIAGLFCHDSRANLSLKPFFFGIDI